MGIDKARKQKQRQKFDQFFGLPITLLKAPHFQRLSGNAVKLLCHLGGQYNGYNNGKLTIVYSELKANWSWSSHTVKRAKCELISAGLIKQTAIGNRRSKEPDRYMLGFRPKDWSADVDMKAIPPPA